jgi:hypothetical protein
MARPHAIRDTVRGALLGATVVLLMIVGVILAVPSKADGNLTPQEENLGDQISSSLCEYLDSAGVNRESMYEAMKIIYENTPSSIDLTDSVDIINYAVYSYCPRHWSELVAFGEGARV